MIIMKSPSIINIEKHIKVGGNKEFSLINNLTKEETTYPLDIIEKPNYYEIDMTNAVILDGEYTYVMKCSNQILETGLLFKGELTEDVIEHHIKNEIYIYE